MKQSFPSLLILFSIFLSSTIWSSRSFAQSTTPNQFYIEETFFPVFVSKNDGANAGGGAFTDEAPKESGLGYDFRTTLGYVWRSMLFGFTFNNYNIKTTRPYTAGVDGFDGYTRKQEWGPTFGVLLGNWRLAFTYFLSASKQVSQTYFTAGTGAVSTDESWNNTHGSGFQLAVGYDFILGAGFGISPTLVYRTVSYKNQGHAVRVGASAEYSGELQTKAIDDDIKPMITLSYRY